MNGNTIQIQRAHNCAGMESKGKEGRTPHPFPAMTPPSSKRTRTAPHLIFIHKGLMPLPSTGAPRRTSHVAFQAIAIWANEQPTRAVGALWECRVGCIVRVEWVSGWILQRLRLLQPRSSQSSSSRSPSSLVRPYCAGLTSSRLISIRPQWRFLIGSASRHSW